MKRFFPILMLVLLAPAECCGESGSRTLIGPRNPDLTQGAMELELGDAQRGVELTLRGLEAATSQREREVALANLCAGYAKLRKLDTALRYCDRLLALNDRIWRAYNNRAVIHILMGAYDKAEQDLLAGEAINPNARKLRQTRAMLRDAVDPVTPRVMIDDRADGPPVRRNE